MLTAMAMTTTKAIGDDDYDNAFNGNVDENVNVRRKQFRAHVDCLPTDYSPLYCIVCLGHFGGLGANSPFHFPVRVFGRF